MKIDFELDREGPLDPMDVLGNIWLTSGNKSINENVTFFDSWLFAFVENLTKMNDHGSFLIDVVDEPDPVRVLSSSEGITFHYKGNEIVVENVAELENALKSASRALVEAYSVCEWNKNPALTRLDLFSRSA